MGNRTERMLLEDAKELGYEGLKVDPNLGNSHSSHDGGDIIIGKRREEHIGYKFATLSELYIIEEKYSSAKKMKNIPVKTEKTDAMIEFAEKIGATPILAVRWSTHCKWSPGAEHRVIDVRELEWDTEENERFSVNPDEAATWDTVEEYFG